MSNLEKIPGFLESLNDSIVVFGDRTRNKRPASSEMIHDLMLKRANEVISYLSSDLSCNNVLTGITSSEPSDWAVGIPCEVLKPNQSWRSGKLTFRVVAEFTPDSLESEKICLDSEKDPDLSSSLDDIRNAIEAN